MGHKCRALAIVCIDFRFHSAIRDYLLSLGLKDNYDMVSLAGATMDLVKKDEHGQPLILKQINISNSLHGVNQVYIIHHMDCGAYGGHAGFKNNLVLEKKTQIEDMKKAEEYIKDVFPKIEVNKVLARLDDSDGENKIDFEVIN